MATACAMSHPPPVAPFAPRPAPAPAVPASTRSVASSQEGCRGEVARPAHERPPSLYDIPALYDLVVGPGPCEPFYRDLAREAGGPVLELACGSGRLTLPLAREGYPVTGLDGSPSMLASARAKARRENLPIRFVQGDMQAFDLRPQRFALIILACNSLAHLTTTESLRACLRAVRRHLAPDGCFAFDIVHPDPGQLARPGTKAERLDLGPNPSSGIAIEEWSSYDPIEQVRTAAWRICDPRIGVREIQPLRLRLIFPQELQLLLAAEGLELVARYGDFARNPLTPGGLNQI